MVRQRSPSPQPSPAGERGQVTTVETAFLLPLREKDSGR